MRQADLLAHHGRQVNQHLAFQAGDLTCLDGGRVHIGQRPGSASCSGTTLRQLTHPGDQFGRSDRLDQELVDLVAERTDRVIDAGVCRHHDDRQGGLGQPDLLHQFQPGDARHLDIGHQDVHRILAEDPQCLPAVCCQHHGPVDAPAQRLAKEGAEIRVVLDHQHDPGFRHPNLLVHRHRGTHVKRNLRLTISHSAARTAV